MILRETFARTIPFGEEYIFLIRNHWAFFGFCVLFLLFKGCLKVWVCAWLVYEKQPALCFPNVQAAFYFSGSLSDGLSGYLKPQITPRSASLPASPTALISPAAAFRFLPCVQAAFSPSLKISEAFRCCHSTPCLPRGFLLSRRPMPSMPSARGQAFCRNPLAGIPRAAGLRDTRCAK